MEQKDQDCALSLSQDQALSSSSWRMRSPRAPMTFMIKTIKTGEIERGGHDGACMPVVVVQIMVGRSPGRLVGMHKQRFANLKFNEQK